MDHRVSPCTTTWVVLPGSCWGAAGEGAARPVSCAGFEVSGRACVVSCARSPGATTPTPPLPPSSPATRASRAARTDPQVTARLPHRPRGCPLPPTPPIPTSSPATRASRAARSERQVVVLFTQRLGECLERLRLALRRRLGSDLGPD